MKNFYEYITQVSRTKQERLMRTWIEEPARSYRWEDVVQEALHAEKRA